MGFWAKLKRIIIPWVYDAKISKEKLIKIINVMDADRNGYISVREVITYVKTYWKLKR